MSQDAIVSEKINPLRFFMPSATKFKTTNQSN